MSELHAKIKEVAEAYVLNHYLILHERIYSHEDWTHGSDDSEGEIVNNPYPPEDEEYYEWSEILESRIISSEVEQGEHEKEFEVTVYARISEETGNNSSDTGEIQERDIEVYVTVEWCELRKDWKVIECQT